ncbi:hypothetical protein H0H93_013552 [Arthromyces matolae]|nr:hypothetical protein H0H93_013552 [Arthromyces matolae]
MRFENFEAAIHVDGSALKEYEVTFDERTKQATCWIASEEGKPFEIVYKPIRAVPFMVSGKVDVDGRHLGGFSIEAYHRNKKRIGYALSTDIARPFLFTTLQVTDNEAIASAPSPALGEIQIEVWHIERGQYSPGMVLDLSINPTHENSKKKMVHHHQVNFGAEQSHNCSFITSKRIEKLVTFVFKYRSLDILIDDGIVPRTKPRVSFKKQKAAKLDADEPAQSSSSAKGLRGMLGSIKSKFSDKPASSHLHLYCTSTLDEEDEELPEYHP